jgi:hypothetical protein
MAAYNLLNGEKRRVVTNHLTACNRIVERWSYPGNPIITQPDYADGGITYTHAPSPSFEHNINTHFNGQLVNNNRSFIDACWIKLYNGLGNEMEHYYWLAPGVVTTLTVIPPQWNITDVATYSGDTNHYVRDIGQRTTP